MLPTLLALGLLLLGCELEVGSELAIGVDGSGTAEVEVRLDEELVAILDDLAVDPGAELHAAVTAADGWTLRRRGHDGGGLRLTAEHARTEDPAAALAELGAGLTDQDPGLDLDIDVEIDGDGDTRVDGTALLRTPEVAGAVDDTDTPMGPDTDELERLIDEHVTGELRVVLPGLVDDHNGEQASFRSVAWALAPDEPVEVSATADAYPLPPEEWLIGGAAALLAVTGLLVGLGLRRRRRR